MVKRDNRKRLQIICSTCQGSGAADHGYGRGRCSQCRGRGHETIANPFYVAPGDTPTWFQLGGGEGWAREIGRQLVLEQGCWSSKRAREFRATCQILQPWRIRSAANCNSVGIAAIAPIVEEAYREHGRLARPGSFFADTGWTAAELGELIVEVRNRQHLWSLGRMQARAKNARFDVSRIPDDRLDALIQRHPNLELVDRLRAERAARLASA